MQRTALLVVCLGAASCSLLLDPDELALGARADSGGSPEAAAAGQSATSGASSDGGSGGSAGEANDGGAQSVGGNEAGGVSGGGNSPGGSTGTAGGGGSGGSSGNGQGGANGGMGSISYMLVARHSAKCFDAGSSDTTIRQWTCNGSAAQRFRIEPYGDYLRIVNVENGKCARVDGTEDTTNVDLYTCNEHSNKQWTLEQIAGGYVRLRNRFASKCAHVQAGGVSDGTIIYAWPCSTNTTTEWSRQHWSIVQQ